MRYRQKILLVMIWLLTLSYGFGGTLLIHQSFRHSLEQARNSAAASFAMTLQTVQLVNQIDVQQEFSNTITALTKLDTASQLGLQLSKDGVSVYQDGMEPKPVLPNSECLSFMFEQEDYHVLQISAAVNTNAVPLQLYILYDVSSLYTARTAQLRTYYSIFFLLVLIGGLTAWLSSRLLTKPLSDLAKAAKKLGSGKLDTRVKRLPKDEIGDVGTEFNRMADHLSDSIAELKESMARQEQFMGSFAHELKTPMTSIIGYADLLRSQSLDEQEAQEAANYIFSEGKRLEALSIKLLDLLMVKHQPPTLKATRMATVIESLASHLQPVYQQSGITLQCRCQDGLCCLDPDLFRSVLVNLLDNARKALPDGGNIYVLGDQTQDGYRVRVLDNGRGMPEEAIRHLTEAFYRVDKARSRAQGGAGLGLTLCSRIIDLHNGTISFASREGNGTCVTIILPEVSA